jgi:hypothetical protein
MKPAFLSKPTIDRAKIAAKLSEFDALHDRICHRSFSDDTDTRIALLSHENRLILDLLIAALES